MEDSKSNMGKYLKTEISKSKHTVISSILIANRGEISSRISRTCSKMGIRSIAVFSKADRDATFVADADTAVYIGESQPSKSYLDQDKIIEAAKRCGADAIHPGYGFLAENAGFARRCESEGIIWIGPHPEAIDKMGSKSKAKDIMQKSNVPTVPGYQGDDQSTSRLIDEAKIIGFPLLLKAAAGGGGKGMRIVESADELEQAIGSAKRESKSAFGDDELIIEKYIQAGRHIEFQIFGDKHGNTIHILERECTIQRRYQKIIEESPSPVMSDTLRKTMGEAAVNAAKALGYDNAGTVEFIYDDNTQDFYFLEVNTRLQVEHPVTEAVTGLDLVEMQIESAQGQTLKITQDEIEGQGYAIEVRLYAENPANNFLPEIGRVQLFEAPCVDGLRVESAIKTGSEISIFYDPMIAKLIVHDSDRVSAIRKMIYALKHLKCLGVITNQAFLIDVLTHEEFIAGKYTTHFIEQTFDLSSPTKTDDIHVTESLIAASLWSWNNRQKKRRVLQSMPSGWRNSRYSGQTASYIVDDKTYDLEYTNDQHSFEFHIGDKMHKVLIREMNETTMSVEINQVKSVFAISSNQKQHFIHHPIIGQVIAVETDRFPAKEIEEAKGSYKTPMPSSIISILVKSGDEVKEGDSLIIISSMKMENTIAASESGVVEDIYVTEGQNVDSGVLLLKMKD